MVRPGGALASVPPGRFKAGHSGSGRAWMVRGPLPGFGERGQRGSVEAACLQIEQDAREHQVEAAVFPPA